MDAAWVLLEALLRDDLGIQHGTFTPNFGGTTGAFTGIYTTDTGRSVFLKWAGDHEVTAREGLRREVHAHAWLPPVAIGDGTLLGHRADDHGMAAAFHVATGSAPATWDAAKVRTAAVLLRDIADAMRHVDAPIGLPDVTTRLALVRANRAVHWQRHLERFCDAAYSDTYAADIAHSDIHRGNILMGPDGRNTTVVDWAWVCRMPWTMDLAMLAVDAGLDGVDPLTVLDAVPVGECDFLDAVGTYGAMLEASPPRGHKFGSSEHRYAIVQDIMRGRCLPTH